MEDKQDKNKIQKISKVNLPVKIEKYKCTSIVPPDPIKRYIQEVNKYPILSKEEEEELIRRYREQHDTDSAKKLLLCHLRLVVRIAFEYYNKYFCSLFDLIQEGNVGLMFALKKFDPSKGVRLSTYAQWWIRAYILKYLMSNYSLIRIGHSRAEKRLFYSLKKAKEKLSQMGYDPQNPKILAEFVKEDEKDVIEMNKRLSESVISLEQPASESERRILAETIEAEDINVEREIIKKEMDEKLKKKLQQFRATLNEREKVIWDKRLVAENPVSLQAIGDKFKISRERVRQIEQRITKKLKKFLVSQKDFNAEDFLRE